MIPLLRNIILLSILVAGTASAATREEPGLISSFTEFRALPRENIIAAKKPIPIRLRATVVYSDPEWRVTFVTNESQDTSLFVHTDSETDYENVTRGSVVEIEGHAIGGQLGAAMHASKIASLGKSVDPIPEAVGVIPANILQLDSQFVSLEAEVASVVLHAGHTLIHAHGSGTHFRIVIPGKLQHFSADHLVGARIQATGTVGISAIESLTVPTFSLFSQGESDLKVVTPAPLGTTAQRPFSVAELLDNDSQFEPGQAVILAGTAVLVEDLTKLWVGDADHTIIAHCGNGTYGIKNGDLVTLSGTYSPIDGQPSIRCVTLATNGNAPKIVPNLYSPSGFLDSPPMNGAVVQMNAALYSAKPSPSGNGTVLELMDGTAKVVAQLLFPFPELGSINVDTASEVTVVGLCRYPPVGSSDSPYLLINSPEDITVTNRQSYTIPPAQILWPLAAVLVTLALAFAWTLSLRRQVATHTAELHQKTDRLSRSEAQLATTTARLRAVHNSVREAILVTDIGGNVLDANIHFSKFFALPMSPHSLDGDQLAHLLASTVVDPHTFSEFWQSLIADPEAERQQHITTLQSDGSQIELESFTAPVFITPGGELTGRVWVFRDITTQLALEERLVHAKKMEAVGRLSAGIAHDFNNLLTGISGSIAISRLRPERTISELDGHLDTAAVAAHRAKELVHRLLGFSRQSNLELHPSCANEVVTKSVETIAKSLPSSITLKTVISPSLWQSRIDNAHLTQVIHDLCSNSKDALPDGGTITVITRNSRRSRAPRSPRSEFVEITVSDDGTGIPSSQLKQVFEPFFTTKEQGKGTGLGLAMSFGVIEQHGGWMTCRSTEGKGTSVSIFLPRHLGEKAPLAPTISPPPPPKKKPTSKLAPGHVLIIDDEPVVRSVSEGIFRHHQFKVSTANNGREGLDWLAANPGEAHVVILDLTMPVLSGKETLREIRALYPGLPVVIASGYLIDLDTFAAEVGSHPDAFVQKPFDVEHILKVVRRVLSSDKPSPDQPKKQVSNRS